MNGTDETGVIVAGSGLAGMIAALAMARAGFSVTLAGPQPTGEDRRTTALMAPALDMLDQIGVLETVRRDAAPLQTIQILDGTNRLLRSPPVSFRAAEIGQDAFGLNIPNTVLFKALADAIANAPSVIWKKTMVAGWELGADRATATLSDGTTISAPLVIAADGRESPARQAAGIALRRRSYPQSALVLTFTHTRDHGFVSTEFHTATGPFTQVPLPGRRSSLVWVVRPEAASELTEVDDVALSLKVEEQMASMLGRVTVDPGRQVYPLSAAMPSRFAASRVALVGEAAHLFPPIGAQGLNLGIRDIADIADIAASHAGDPGAPAALASYDMRRRPDVTARSAAVNLLNLSLLSDLLPAQLARSAGLGLLAVVPPLRGFFMREGMQPGAGFARAFSAVREQVGWKNAGADGEEHRGDAQYG